MDFLTGPMVDLPPPEFRVGAKGTHTSRTMMLAELSTILGVRPKQIEEAVLKGNLLAKTTMSGRRLTLQRLKELYVLDRSGELFQWLELGYQLDPSSLPLLALLTALARDPLLRATAKPILSLPSGAEFSRDAIRDALTSIVGARLNAATLDKVVRNAASSWTQSGHLTGRTIKKRTSVEATPVALVHAIRMAQMAGFRGNQLLSNGWTATLDVEDPQIALLLDRARSAGLLDMRRNGSSIDVQLKRPIGGV